MMASKVDDGTLPSADSPDLVLRHPTPNEQNKCWTNTFSLWAGALPYDEHLKASAHMRKVPLGEGTTSWILVDKNLPPDERPILNSCTSIRKRALKSDPKGNVQEVLVQAVASVMCPAEYRGRGYGMRHMALLAKELASHHSDQGKVAGTVLYSDIGKKFYAKFGWEPHATNWQVVLAPEKQPKPASVRDITLADIPGLCQRDEAMLRDALQKPIDESRDRLVIMPDFDQISWALEKDVYSMRNLLDKTAPIKGAIAGKPGRQVWALWAQQFKAAPDQNPSANKLNILRLVVEGDESANVFPSLAGNAAPLDEEQASNVEAVLQAAKAEAGAWGLSRVNLWEPSPGVQKVMSERNIQHSVEERDEKLACELWYDEKGAPTEAPLWINNEFYAWC